MKQMMLKIYLNRISCTVADNLHKLSYSIPHISICQYIILTNCTFSHCLRMNVPIWAKRSIKNILFSLKHEHSLEISEQVQACLTPVLTIYPKDKQEPLKIILLLLMIGLLQIVIVNPHLCLSQNIRSEQSGPKIWQGRKFQPA